MNFTHHPIPCGLDSEGGFPDMAAEAESWKSCIAISLIPIDIVHRGEAYITTNIQLYNEASTNLAFHSNETSKDKLSMI